MMSGKDVFGPKTLRAMMQLEDAELSAEAERFLRLALLMPQGDVSTTWYVFYHRSALHSCWLTLRYRYAYRPIIAAYCCVIAPRNVDASRPDLYKRTVSLCGSVLDVLDAAAQHMNDPTHQSDVKFCHEVMAVARQL